MQVLDDEPMYVCVLCIYMYLYITAHLLLQHNSFNEFGHIIPHGQNVCEMREETSKE